MLPDRHHELMGLLDGLNNRPNGVFYGNPLILGWWAWNVLIKLGPMRIPSRSKVFLSGMMSLVLLGCLARQLPESQTEELQTTPVQVTSAIPPSVVPDQPAVTPTATHLPTPTFTPEPTRVIIGQLCSPLKDHSLAELTEIISDPYHPPPMGRDERHQGVDFSYYRRGERMSIEGVEVQAVLPGRVAAAIIDSFPFGNSVIVETPAENLPRLVRQRLGISEDESLYILYAHLQNAPLVVLGEPVTACQVLGGVGKTGNAGVAHLHLEMRHGPPQVQFPVMAYYLANHTPEERKNYLRWATSGEFLHFDPMDLLLMDWPQSLILPGHKELH